MTGLRFVKGGPQALAHSDRRKSLVGRRVLDSSKDAHDDTVAGLPLMGRFRTSEREEPRRPLRAPGLGRESGGGPMS